MARARFLISGLAAALFCGQSWACSIPVFRFALERWDADAYQLLIFHRGPLTKEQAGVVEALKKWAAQEPVTVNLAIRTCDLADKPETALLEFWQTQANAQTQPNAQTQVNAQTPWVVVLYPIPGPPKAAWSGPLDSPVLGTLADSPVRREVAGRLLKGDSVVWIMLDSGKADLDRKTEQWLNEELARLGKEIKLPEQPGPEDDVPGSYRTRTELPLRLAFSALRVSRTAPEERALVEMLQNMDAGYQSAAAPVLFPVFGKARILCGITGEDLTAAEVAQATGFLCAGCQCTFKEEIHGTWDLLVAADWSALTDGRAIQDPAPPPVIGLSAAARAAMCSTAAIGGAPDAAQPGAAVPHVTEAAAPSATPSAAPPGQVQSSGSLYSTLFIGGAALLILVVAATLILRSRNREAGK